MGEQKISDGVMIGLYFAFVLFAFTTLIVSFDNSQSLSSVSGELSTLDSGVTTDYNSLETRLEQSTNTTGFVVKENIYIDERGQEQVDISSDTSKSSFKKFFSNLMQSDSVKKNSYLNVKIVGFIISFIIISFLFMALRAILGGRDGRI